MNYTFVYNEEGSKLSTLQRRYKVESFQTALLDIFLLSQCDYLVCTFSSNVCRMAYELMQVRYVDASWRFKSLDDMFYFHGQNPHTAEAIQDHIPESKEEIELKVGDSVVINYNLWNGYYIGTNTRTEKLGLFPSYKIKDVIKSAKIRNDLII